MPTEVQSRKFTFTLNNYTEYEFTYIEDILPYDYICFGLEEAPTTGTPHMQGWIYHNTPIKLSTLIKKFKNRAHIEIMKGSFQQNMEYCSKSGIFLEFGNPPEQGKRYPLEEIKKEIINGKTLNDIAFSHPSAFAIHNKGILELFNKLKPFKKTRVVLVKKPLYVGHIVHNENDLQLYDGEQELTLFNNYNWANNFILSWLHNCPVKCKMGYQIKYINPSVVYLIHDKSNPIKYDWWDLLDNIIEDRNIENSLFDETISISSDTDYIE